MTGAITVRCVAEGDPLRFEVAVNENDSATRHEVTMTQNALENFAGNAFTPEQCVEAAFRFLLDREPKEAILSRFDISIIKNYFPEFSREFLRYLAAR